MLPLLYAGPIFTLSFIFVVAIFALSFKAFQYDKQRKKTCAVALTLAGLLCLTAPAQAGNCGGGGFAQVQVQPSVAVVNPFAVPIHPQFVSTLGAFVTAPQVSPFFIQAFP